MYPVIDNYHNLINPFVIGSNGEQPGYTHIINSAAFTSSVTDLKTHVANRNALVSEFLK